jgi:hypothetical protein
MTSLHSLSLWKRYRPPITSRLRSSVTSCDTRDKRAALCVQSGNPGGRPKGLAKAVRELVGEDGKALVELMYSIAMDPQRKDTHRMRAAEWLGDRGWGKAAVFQPVEEYDPLGLADLQASAESFTAKVLRLASSQDEPDTT